MQKTKGAARPITIRHLTVPEVAEALRLGVRTVWAFIQAGDLPHRRYGRSVRVLESDLTAFVQRSAGNDAA